MTEQHHKIRMSVSSAAAAGFLQRVNHDCAPAAADVPGPAPWKCRLNVELGYLGTSPKCTSLINPH